MGQIKVITYAHPKDPVISEVCNRDQVLHICATTSLTQAMVDRDDGLKKNVISAQWFTDAILGEWMESTVKLEQFMSLSKLLRKGSIEKMKDTPMSKSFRRNKQDALLAIRQLAELGIKPQDLSECASTAYESELAILWTDMLKQDEGSNYFKRLGQVTFALRHPAAFKMMAGARIKEMYKKGIDSEHQLAVSEEKLNLDGEIVLHGFYFLTPLQQQMFQALRHAGVSITFLQLYHPKYPHTFSFIETVLGEENNWVPVEKWTVGDVTYEGTITSRYFASLFEEKTEQIHAETMDRIKYKNYRNIYQWIDDFAVESLESETETHHLSPNFNVLEERVKGFFPERYQEDRNFLSYPIGQYLLHLHRIWDQERKKQLVDIETLMECFISPWLSVTVHRTGDKKPASAYLHHLHTIRDFFPRKMSLDAWKISIINLIDQIENSAFLVRNIEGEEESHRFIDEIRNPLKKIGPYAIPAEELREVVLIIEIINEHVQIFFNDMNNELSLNEYFQLILKLIYKQSSEKDFLEHETNLIDQIWQLSDSSQNYSNDRKYHIEDISEAVHILLGGNLDEVDPTATNVEQLHSFAEIDGVIFKDTAIHVAGLDEFSFPHTDSTLAWPLMIQTVELMCERVPAMKVAVLREKNRDAIPRFLFYTLLLGEQPLILSWFREWQEKHSLEPSVYLKILHESVLNDDSYIIKPTLPNIPTQAVTPMEVDVNRAFKQYSDYALSEIQMCPRRFFSSYLTQPYSVYRSEFHYNFLYQNLFSLLSNFTDNPVIVLKDVFPHWSDFKHRAKGMMAKSHFTSVKYKSYTYNGLEYYALSGMKYLANPADSTLGWKMGWGNKGYKFGQIIPDFTETQPSANCKYCPHMDFCPDARYAIDDERYVN